VGIAKGFLAHLSKIWRELARGIWESRGTSRHFTFSNIMAWVAFDGGIKMIEEFRLDRPVAQWRASTACSAYAMTLEYCRAIGLKNARLVGNFPQAFTRRVD
jgi:GH15 family glucan-1,4-alpha-glucosidase